MRDRGAGPSRDQSLSRMAATKSDVRCRWCYRSDCLIAANAKPIWLNAVGEKLTGPIGKALANQCEARHGNENGFRF